MNDTVVAIVSAFFVIGIAAGIIAVIAMSVLRAERRGNPGNHDGLFGSPEEPPDPGRDDPYPGPRRRWPGDADNDFSGR